MRCVWEGRHDAFMKTDLMHLGGQIYSEGQTWLGGLVEDRHFGCRQPGGTGTAVSTKNLFKSGPNCIGEST
jgi:hypothetical protein